MFWRFYHFFAFFQLLFSALAVDGEELYVTAYPNGDPCPHSVVKNCHNLSYYFREKDEFFRDNTTFNFLQGIHQLQPNQIFLMENLTNISFVGQGDIVVGSDKLVTQSTSVLKCSSEQGATGSGGINFVNCVDITIRRITLTECNHSPALVVNASTNVDLLNLSILNSTYYGYRGYKLHIINSNNVSIVSSVIANCTTGARVAFQSTPTQLNGKHKFNFYIDSLNIIQNHIGNGLEVEFSQENYFVNFEMESCNFLENFVNFALRSSSCEYMLQVRNLSAKYDYKSSVSLYHSSSCRNNSMPVISLSNSTFSSSNGQRTVDVALVPIGHTTTGILSIASSLFFNNFGFSILQVKYSGGTEVPLHNQYKTNFKVYITDTVFSKNMPLDKLTLNVQQGCANFLNIETVIMTNCTFADNNATSIRMFNSVVMFEGENNFLRNRATDEGGTMNLVGNSYIMFNEQSRLVFIENHSLRFGGAIYVDGTGAQPGIADHNVYFCFFQPLNRIKILTGKTEHFFFVNNTAETAGTAVYAEHVGNCYFFMEDYVIGTEFFLGISSFVQSGDSIISSYPRSVCFCENGTKNCDAYAKIFSNIYPGDTIEFSIVAVGSNDGLTPGTIRFDNFDIPIARRSTLAILPFAACKDIRHTVLSDTPIKDQVLFMNLYDDNYVESKHIIMEILECKRGFYLSPKTNSCDCIEDVYNHATCYPSKHLIQRSNKIYVGYNDLQNCTIVSSSCPFDYCISKAINITLNNSYVQCSGSRTGHLCGSCSENFSLVLGSNACKDCRDKQGFLFLILPFAMAGFALVFLLLFLNLTVSVGTINGLVFLANIIKIYEPFFPSESSIPFLSQFIAWINLDLGIETCFFDGMSAVVKVGLQFVFPLYVWLIITMIIVVSKYSSRLAHYIRNSIIPVLATLILLSYTKLINAVILVLSRVSVKCGDSVTVYWFVNPTQEYLTGGHTVLFVISLVVMGFFVVPYTLFLLLYPLQGLLSGRCRQRMSWAIFKLKPFFDAYRGPYTDVFCIWPGILLVVRIVLSLVVSQTEDATISFSILIPLLIVVISTLSSRSVYKSKYLHLIDAGFIVALLLLSYLKIVIMNDELAIIYYCNAAVLSLSFVMFCGIFLFHAYKFSAIGKVCWDRFKVKESEVVAISDSKTVQNYCVKRYDATEYREPLLDITN